MNKNFELCFCHWSSGQASSDSDTDDPTGDSGCGRDGTPTNSPKAFRTPSEFAGLGVTAFGADFDQHFGVDSEKSFSILGSDTSDQRNWGGSHSSSGSDQHNQTSHSTSSSSLTAGVAAAARPVAAALLRSASALSVTRDSTGTCIPVEHKRSSAARQKEMNASLQRLRSFFEGAKAEPELWGTSVRHIWKLWEFVAEDLTNYALAHRFDRKGCHVCLVPSCKWHHSGPFRVFRQSATSSVHMWNKVEPSMHLVVERYVKPWTKDLDRAGLGMVWNAGSSSVHKQITPRQMCAASVFISHTWGDQGQIFHPYPYLPSVQLETKKTVQIIA